MKIPKPTDSDKNLFRDLVPDDAEIKPMFGNLAAFVNGNMFMGLFGPEVGLRLSEDDRNELRGVAGSGDFGPEGRPMKEYVSIPEAWRKNPVEAAPWIERAFDHVSAFPPKKKKPNKK